MNILEGPFTYSCVCPQSQRCALVPLTDVWSASIQLALRVLVFFCFLFFRKGDPGVRDFMNLEESAYFENLFRVEFCLKHMFQKSNDKQPLPLPRLVPYRPRRVILWPTSDVTLSAVETTSSIWDKVSCRLSWYLMHCIEHWILLSLPPHARITGMRYHAQLNMLFS